jgi:hypothetical protein
MEQEKSFGGCMKKIFVAFGIVLGVLVFIDISDAHGCMKCNDCAGCCAGNQNSRMYDAKSVETVKGEVVSVDEMNGMCSGVHLTLKTETELVSVHLGPSWFLNNQDLKVAKEDKVEIKGSRVQFDGKSAIIAIEVLKGDQVLKLRDENGIPVWSGSTRKMGCCHE